MNVCEHLNLSYAAGMEEERGMNGCLVPEWMYAADMAILEVQDG
jgi:hypothetical protein